MPTFVKAHRSGNHTVRAYSRRSHKSLLIKRHEVQAALVNSLSGVRSPRNRREMIKAMNTTSDLRQQARRLDMMINEKYLKGYALLKRRG